MSDNDFKRNASGYFDPTAFEAVKKVQTEERIKDLIGVIRYITRLAGFEIEGRITFRDKKTGILLSDNYSLDGKRKRHVHK